MIGKLRTNSTELKMISCQFLLHPDADRIHHIIWIVNVIVLLLDDTALCGSFPDEEIIVINDAFEIVAAVIKLP